MTCACSWSLFALGLLAMLASLAFGASSPSAHRARWRSLLYLHLRASAQEPRSLAGAVAARNIRGPNALRGIPIAPHARLATTASGGPCARRAGANHRSALAVP